MQWNEINHLRAECKIFPATSDGTDSDNRNEYRRRIVIKILLACSNQMCLFRYPLLPEAQSCLLLHSNTKKA